MKGLIAKSQAEAAATIGISTRVFADWCQHGCPSERGSYPIREIIAWAKENRWAAKPVVTKSEDEAIIESATGPEVERYKTEIAKHRAELLRLQVEEQGGDLVRVEKIQGWMSRTAGLLRAGLERLQREYGPDAYKIVCEVLDQLERELDEGILDCSGDEEIG